VKAKRSIALLAPVALLLLARPRFAPAEGTDACLLPANAAAVYDIRTRAEESCARRGITCESGALDYVRCVNTVVAAAVRGGRIRRECRQRAEVTPARCAQPGTPGSGPTQ
jgi:hypothetical protein